MSRRCPALISVLFVFIVTTVSAQENPRANIFAGYSYASSNLGSGTHVGTHGYEVAIRHNFLPWLGIVIDTDAHWGTALVPFCFGSGLNTCAPPAKSDSHLYTLTGGAEISKTIGKVTPFARALFGVATLDACPISLCESKASFAQVYGGGMDLRVSERRSARAFNVTSSRHASSV